MRPGETPRGNDGATVRECQQLLAAVTSIHAFRPNPLHYPAISPVDRKRALPGVSSRLLLQHDLPATGGASGSPIVGASGRVVALLNAGNLFMVNGDRVPNAALINFA